jgi:hypothetical protein
LFQSKEETTGYLCVLSEAKFLLSASAHYSGDHTWREVLIISGAGVAGKRPHHPQLTRTSEKKSYEQ